MSTAEQILDDHQFWYSFEGYDKCRCGREVPRGTHSAHVVAALTNAGKTIVDLLEADEGVCIDITAHDENVLTEVYEAMRAAGIDDVRCVDAVNQILNRRILFRRPGPAAARVEEGGDRP